MLRAPYVFECAEDPGGHQKHIEIHPITLGMGGMGQDEAALTHHQKSSKISPFCQDMSRYVKIIIPQLGLCHSRSLNATTCRACCSRTPAKSRARNLSEHQYLGAQLDVLMGATWCNHADNPYI